MDTRIMHSLQVVHMSMQRYDLCRMHYIYSTLPNTLLNFLEVLFCINFHNFLWQLYLTAFVICIVNVYACITKITSRKNDFDFNGGLWLWKVVSELGKRSNIITIYISSCLFWVWYETRKMQYRFQNIHWSCMQNHLSGQ